MSKERDKSPDLRLSNANHIHYVHSYVSDGREQRYHIDVVTEAYFSHLLVRIDRELKRAVRLVRSRRKVIKKSIALIAASVKKARSPSAARARMEYRGPWGTHDPS